MYWFYGIFLKNFLLTVFGDIISKLYNVMCVYVLCGRAYGFVKLKYRFMYFV